MNHRMTAFMKGRNYSIAEVSQKILEDEEVRWPWLFFAYALLKKLGLPHPVREEAQGVLDRRGGRFAFTEGEEEPALLWDLIDTIKIRLPEVYHIFGEHPVHYHQFTLADLAARASDERTREVLLQAAEAATPMSAQIEGLPHNPITIREDPSSGDLHFTAAASERPTRRHFQEIASLVDARWPARPRGRPPKPPGDKPPKPSKRTLDPELAERAYEMDQKGEHWRKIAQICYPHRKPAELRTRKMEKHINRLIENHDIFLNKQRKSRTE